jgi:hypothetical protein
VRNRAFNDSARIVYALQRLGEYDTVEDRLGQSVRSLKVTDVRAGE